MLPIAVARSFSGGVAALCISGFMNDVMFAHNSQEYERRKKACILTVDRREAAKDSSSRLILELTHEGQHHARGGVWYLRLPGYKSEYM